ncbi:MAG: hypothetical protein GY711_34155, partial [bacterium]|nr:hypothetical protein [bacterium]
MVLEDLIPVHTRVVEGSLTASAGTIESLLDDSSGTDVDPADNSAAATVTLWDSSTPILDLGDPITGVEGDTVSLEAAFVNVPRSAFVTDDFDA